MIHGAPPEEGGVSCRRDEVRRWEALDARLIALEAQQTALLNELRAVGEQLRVVGGVLEQVRDRPRFFGLLGGPPPRSGLGLALYRILELVRSPREAFAFLANLEWVARQTSRRSRRRRPDAPWRLHLQPLTYARALASAFLGLMFGSARAHYRIVHRREARFSGRRRKVLHIIPNLHVGGSTQLVIDLFEYLGLDYEMQILTAAVPAGGGPVGAIAHVVPLGASRARFAHVLDAFQPDLVHVHYWGGSDEPWYAEAFEALSGRGLAVVENVNTPVAPLRHPCVGSYVFVSDYVRGTFAPDLDPALSRIIYPGIDRQRFTPQPGAVGENADVGDTVLMVYRLERDKLDDASIEVLIAVARRRPATRFVIVGQGPLLEVFLQRTQEAGVRANFEFTGNVPFAALPALYGRAGTFIAPVVRESFGQVVPFAMSMGLAVCGNDIGALSEILDGTQTLGATPAETVEKTVALLDDKAFRRACGAHNLERSALFGVEAMVDQYDALYQGFLPRYEMPGFPEAEIFR